MPVGIGVVAWLRLCVVLLGGSVPLALLGIAIGYWVPHRAALPVANVAYLVLAFGGGLFIPPQLFPEVLDAGCCSPAGAIGAMKENVIAEARRSVPATESIPCRVLIARLLSEVGRNREDTSEPNADPVVIKGRNFLV